MAIALVACGLLLSASASAAVVPELLELVKGREAEGVFDRYEPPEKWVGKQHDFEPIMTWTKVQGHGEANIRVTHTNTEEHFIEAIYVKDHDGNVIGGNLLSRKDKPAAKIKIPDETYKLTAFAIGNLHG